MNHAMLWTRGHFQWKLYPLSNELNACFSPFSETTIHVSPRLYHSQYLISQNISLQNMFLLSNFCTKLLTAVWFVPKSQYFFLHPFVQSKHFTTFLNGFTFITNGMGKWKIIPFDSKLFNPNFNNEPLFHKWNRILSVISAPLLKFYFQIYKKYIFTSHPLF